ncbi:uncharacterized protein LOC131152396 isoform X2 [Malania oleifera]|uniref:uncharacterized protein LOC131152396 isoform X2 n=1 Tax=Malania oleifera TaxID=397392 RepID=UPI0025AE3775|nr:uncharacterized protein LOC131152396 isoform X2 [Malania oleifera]
MAPPSPLDISRLNSTSGLLAVLDLNEQQNQNMEDMDIDQVIDVPDTPDRLALQIVNQGESVEKDSVSLVAGHSGNSNSFDEGFIIRPRDRGRLVSENRHNRQLHFCPGKKQGNPDETDRHTNSLVYPSESSSASLNSHLLRRMVADKTFKHDSNHSSRAQCVDKGKALCSKFSSKSAAFQGDDNTVLDLTKQSEHERIPQNVVLRGASIDVMVKELEEESLENNDCSSNASIKPCKRVGKTDEHTCKGITSGMDNGKGIYFSRKPQFEGGKSVSASLNSTKLPKVIGQKRLVRNGCISPHNIARAKELAEQHSNGPIEVPHDDTKNTVLNGKTCLIDSCNSVAEANSADKVKGKGVITHPCTSKEQDARTGHLSSSSSLIHNEEANKTSDGSRDAFEGIQGLGGWRSTRNRSKVIYLPDGVGGHSRRSDRCFVAQNGNKAERRDSESAKTIVTSYPEARDAVLFPHGPAQPFSQTTSSLLTVPDRVNRRHRSANALTKRQKKQGSTPSHPGECSTSVYNDSEIVLLRSSGESSNSRSVRDQNHHHQGALHPIIEIDELSPEIRHNGSQDFGCTDDDDSDARARQVEADEILARELQEQLYHEAPIQEEGAQRASSSGSRLNSLLRGSLASNLRRQSQSRSNHSNPVGRGNQARVAASNRMAQLRRHVRNQPRTTLSRERIFPFPVHMDLDMRMDILEALESAVDDLNGLRRVTSILGVQRDFNENDYEMLLALDENNHQHGGASVHQINSLPLSTVESENLEEACAVCLETPTIGDTIRHLPCLHKFHKDCIDPWLSRRTSCPVCKSSIT